MSTIQQLRTQLRCQRQAISATQRQQAAHALSRQLLQQSIFLRSQHIACYLHNDGEISLTPVIQRIWQMGKQCYLPVLHPSKRGLWFLPYRADTSLRLNRFAIAEPVALHQARPAWALNLVLMPLVAFDSQGNRLGMGGGYYDASFAYLHSRQWRKQPLLLGVAFECQHLPLLPTVQAWDIPLQGAVTEVGMYWFNSRA